MKLTVRLGKKGERSQPAKQTADWSVVTSVVATTTAERFSFWEIQELGTNHVQGIKKIAIKITIQMTLAVLCLIDVAANTLHQQ